MVVSTPYNEEFEKALLVGILSDPSLLPKITMTLEPKDFYKERHKEIFEAMTEIEPDNLDSLSVQDRLTDEETKNYFIGLVHDSDSLLPGLSNLLYYTEVIKNKSRLRDGIELSREIAALCYQENIDAEEAQVKLEALFSGFLKSRVAEGRNDSTEESFREFMDTLGVRVHDTQGTRTGFREIDAILHKLEGLIILAARPSLGKTGLAISIARNVAETKNVMFFSLEQPRTQIFERILSSESQVDHEDITTGVFVANSNDSLAIQSARENLENVFQRLTIDDTPNVTASYIASASRQKYFEDGDIGLIIVDYLHIMKLNTGNLVETLGEAVKELRALGRELNCPVLVLSQLSRQSDTTREDGQRLKRRPELTDLRSSGEIEQTADVVLMLHRDSYYEPTGYIPPEDEIEVHIRKNRNGRTGTVSLTWYPRIMKYANRDMFGGTAW